MAEVFIVRHGDTALNDPNDERFRAWSNPELNESGIKHAKEAGKALSDYPIKKIICSDLFRTYQTAHLISVATGAKLAPTSKLRPWDLGFLTGEKVSPENITKMDFYRKHPDVPIPEGEAYHSFALRYTPLLEKCLQFARSHPDEKLVLVTHSRNLMLTRAFIIGKPLNELNYENELPPGSILKLRLGRDSKWKLEELPHGKRHKDE